MNLLVTIATSICEEQDIHGGMEGDISKIHQIFNIYLIHSPDKNMCRIYKGCLDVARTKKCY